MTKILGQILVMLGALLVSGCGGGDDMSQSEVEYLSRMDQARFFQQQGELKASTREARNAIDVQPERIEPYFILIDNLLTAGDGQTAEAQLDELRQMLDGESPEQRATLNQITLMTARARLINERPDAALEALEQIRSPDQSTELRAQRLSGDAHRAAGRPGAARESYRRILKRDPESIMALLGLSRLSYTEGDRESAREYYERAHGLNPDDPEVRLWRARMAHREARYEEAIEAYTLALEDIGRYEVMTRRKYNTMSALIDVLRKNGDASQAFVYEEMLAKSAPGTIQSAMEAARKAYQQGQLANAARHLEEVLQQAPTHVPASVLLGIIRFQQGAFEKAEQLLAPHADKAESGELTKMLAAARIRMQRPEEARKMLEALDPRGDDPGVVALLGFAALSSGEIELGRGLIEQSLAMEPSNTSLRVRFARYLLSRNKANEAIEELETAIEQTPEADGPRSLLARVLAQQGDYERARSVIGDWLDARPESVQALNTAGDIAQITGDTETAQARYRQAIELGGSAPQSHYALGALLTRQGRGDEADEHFRSAVRGAPDDRRLIRALMASADGEAEREETTAFLETLNGENESAVGPALTLLALALNNGDKERASRFAEVATARIPDSEQATSLIGSIYGSAAARALGEDNLQRSQKIIQMGRQRFRNHEGLALMEARLQFERGKDDDARDILRTVKTEYPASAKPYALEADYLAESGNYRDAAELYQLARNKADNVSLVLRHANALRRDEQTMSAIEVLEMGVQQFPDTPRLHQELGQSYTAAEQIAKARDAYERTLNLDPNAAVALNNLAWLIHQEDTQRALELAQRAYGRNPENASIADTYGWILLQDEQVEQSIEILEKAHEQAPDSTEIAGHLAEAHSRAGNADRARELRKRSRL